MNHSTKEDAGNAKNSLNRKQPRFFSLKNEEHLRILEENMFNMVYRMSPDWSVLIELAGKDFLADTIKPVKNWMDKYIPGNDHNIVKEAIKEALKSNELFVLEHRIIRKDDTIGWVLVLCPSIMMTEK